MPPKRRWNWKWLKKDKAYIEMMKQYENNDAFDTLSIEKETWREISTKTGSPANYCRRKWVAIKHNYFKLKYMILNGRVTEDMVRNHVKTSKYLDGTLDFLDRFMFKIPEAALSASACNFVESAFGEFPCTQSGSSVEKLIKVKENSVIEVIKDYTQETGKEPMSILPNIEIYESNSSITDSKETFVNLGMDQTIKEVYRIDDDSNDVVYMESDILSNTKISRTVTEEFVNLGMDQVIKDDYRIDDDLNDIQFVEPDMLPNIQIKQEHPIGDNVLTNDTNSCLLRNILTSTNNEDTKSSKNSSKPSLEKTGDLARFLVKYANTTIDREKDEDCNLKEYMNDLAEVLCRLLVPGQRKHFLSQIDLMVSEILEGT